MANLGRALKLPSSLSARTRPLRPARTLSTASDASTSSASSYFEEQQFVVSGCNTPAMENPSPRNSNIPAPSGPIAGESIPQELLTHATKVSASPRLIRTKPIAIEIPGLRKSSAAPVYTPPEPLSGRGDVQGGYFPLHEEQSRLRRPHPFHLDIKRARNRSISQAAEAAGNSPSVDDAALAMMSDPVPASSLSAANSSSASIDTPVASYIPTGMHHSPLPMGKYYPSNYEKRNSPTDSQQTLRPPSSTSGASPAKSDSYVPNLRGDPKHSRSDSEAKRRLQQYQRDMVAQAKMAASQVLGSGTRPGGPSLAASSLNPAAMTHLHLGAAMIHRPVSPRLIPLGSPGPVTPMELEEDEGSYLLHGQSVAGPDAERQMDDISRALQAQQTPRHREGGSSSVVSFGPLST